MNGAIAHSAVQRRLALLGAGLTLVLAAWIVATPPFGGPDEASHYLRALTITNGHILGPKIPYPLHLDREQQAFINQDTTAVVVPARLSPPDVTCVDGTPDLRGSCVEATPNGNFPPLPYLLPAAAIGVSHDATTGLWLSRAATALPSLAFLLLALVLLWSGTGWALVGLLAAVTPMVLFSSSILNSSGVEITACLAFASAVLRISRPPVGAPRWVWAAFTLAGAVAIIAWPLGIVFVAADVVLLGLLLGRQGVRELWRRSRDGVRVSALVLAAAGIEWAVYSRISGAKPAKVGFTPVLESLKLGVDQLPGVLHDAVGTFAGLAVPLPDAAYWLWWALVLGLLAGALVLGHLRQRLVVVTVAILTVAFPVLFYAWVDRFSGFGIQGREVLPPLLLIPMVSGEVIYRQRAERWQGRTARLGVAGVIAFVAGFQGYAWFISARAAAGGADHVRFYLHAAWSPPLGWLPWIVLAALGTLALFLFALGELWRPLAGPARPLSPPTPSLGRR